MKYLKLFENKLESIKDNLISDVNTIFADFVDDGNVDFGTYYISRGFIEVDINYTKCDFNNFDKQIECKRKILEDLEDISIGVKRLKDIYPDLKITPEIWQAEDHVRIRISI